MTVGHVCVHVGDLPHRGRVHIELERILMSRLPSEPLVEFRVGHVVVVIVPIGRIFLHLAPR